MKLFRKLSIKETILIFYISIFFLLNSCVDSQANNEPNVTSSSSTLSLQVIVENNSCQPVDKPINLVLSFTNLTNEVITIEDLFQISKNRFGSGGNIIPIITLNGKDVYSLLDNSMMDFPVPQADKYIEIQPYGILDKTIQYQFPREILESRQSDQEIIVTPASGRYLVKLVYYQSRETVNTWHGSIESNQFEVCIE